MGQHGGAEGRRVGAVRPLALAGCPGEQAFVGRLQPVPDFLDVVRRIGPEPRHRGLGEAGRNADAQRAGDQLEEGPAAGLVERVEPALDLPGQRQLAGRGQRLDHLGEGRRLLLVRSGRPDQRDRFGEVAHIIVGHGEQDRIGPLRRQTMDHGRLGIGEGQGIGQGRQGIAALGVRHGPEIFGHQPELAVAAVFEGQPVEQLGEGFHAATGSSSSVSSP